MMVDGPEVFNSETRLTRSRPLARPPCGLQLRQIPFAVSQTAQVLGSYKKVKRLRSSAALPRRFNLVRDDLRNMRLVTR
jgi:hypothetical protein